MAGAVRGLEVIPPDVVDGVARECRELRISGERPGNTSDGLATPGGARLCKGLDHYCREVMNSPTWFVLTSGLASINEEPERGRKGERS